MLFAENIYGVKLKYFYNQVCGNMHGIHLLVTYIICMRIVYLYMIKCNAYILKLY